MNKIKNQIIKIGIMAASVMYLSSCNVPEIKHYSYPSIDVRILQSDKYQELGITNKNKEDDTTYLLAKDFDADGTFDQIEVFKHNNETKPYESIKAINKLYEKTIHNIDYNATFESRKKMFGLNIDTIIFSCGQHTALTDINNDGKYDVIQTIGSSPGAYEMIITKSFLQSRNQTEESFFGYILGIPAGENTRVIDDSTFNKHLSYSLNQAK
ncbi:MAG: hypothetical protein WC758_06135 [Candidatus Woesearchaeota archaeon]|jgi:hypothetical protein